MDYNTPYLERTVIGIPKPGATDAPTDLDALIQWLLKYLRPITISPIFLALFNGIMAYRLASSEEFQLLLSEANVGFQRERSTHQIILYINSMIYLANTRRLPLWTFSTDIDKAYDKTPLVTQYQVGRHRGLEAFTRSTITTYKMSRISIQAIGTNPHTVQPDSGQNQGDAKVCSTFPLTTEPAVTKCYDLCLLRDPTETIQTFIQWVDDSFGVAPSLEALLELLHLYVNTITALGYKIGKITIACNGPAGLFAPKTITFNEMTIPVARSLRILGACIHVAIVSPCTPHRCTICKMPSKVPLCDACTPNLLLKIEQQYMTPQDKSTLIRSQIVPAMLYAPYSCTPTQTWIKSTLSLLYQAITKKSYGGYKSYYALRLAQGGLQFTDPKTLIAHHTANLLNRELVPCSVQT